MSFLGFGEKNYATIVGPLKKMAEDLTAYKAEQAAHISDLESQRAEIDTEINASTTEIAKSEFTATKISELIMSDLDGNGIADVDELPETPEDEEPPA